MKNIKIHALLSGVFLLGIFVHNIQAQEPVPVNHAPGNIYGSSILVHSTGATGTLPGSGYYLLLPANTSLNYNLIGSGSISSSTGTYTYSEANGAGTLAFSDSVIGLGTNLITFSTDTAGAFNLIAGTNTEFGTIQYAAGQAPASLSNHSYYINISGGALPFASSGSAIFSPSASENSYNVFPTSGGISPSSGTYAYSQANAATGTFSLADSASGSSTEYFGFQSPSNGMYLVTEASGGYQTGTFTVSNLMPALFFEGQVDLSQSVNWLQFSNGTNFGYYDVMDFGFPLFYHFDMGFECYFDANNSAHGAFLWDFASGGFFYTDPQTFPFLYDFKLNTWLYWFPNPNDSTRYTCNPRYFWDFNTGQTITK